MSDTSLLERRRKLLGPAYQLFYDRPLHLVRGEGVWLYDADGIKYLDMYNNVPHVGHCHPHVVDAITKQVGLLNTHTRYLHENVVDYAERLIAKLPGELDVAMFSCTGTEANELALRIARTCTGGTGIIVTDFAYHGNSHAIAEISTEENEPEDRSDYVATVPAPDVYRGEYTGKDAGEKYAEHVATAIEQLEARGVAPAAFLIDTIASSNGIVAMPPGYMRRAAEIVRQAGALFVADEVQPGFGRTGRNFWGYEVDEFVPDIVTMGKPMGNGHPLAATVTRSDLVDRFSAKTGYFNTYGGNPVSCAAGLAVLDVIEDENLQENAMQTGQHITAGLQSLASRHDCIGDVRGSGLFIGVELVADRDRKTPAPDKARQVVNGLCERGVLTGLIGPQENILKLRPPMVLTTADADFMLERLDEVLM